MEGRARSRSLENLEDAKRKQDLVASHKKKSSHTLFFGTDDVSDLKKKTDEDDADVPEKPTAEEPTFANANEAMEWREIRALARSVFHVYFANDDCDEDVANMKEQNSNTKKSGVMSKINGTMPWLHPVLKSWNSPAIVKNPCLFTEASFRGMAQVSTTTMSLDKQNGGSLSNFYPHIIRRSFFRIIR